MKLARIVLALTGCLFLAPRGSFGAPDGSQPREYQLEVGGGTIDLTIDAGDLALSDKAIEDWVEASARAVTSYYGTFPVKDVSITIEPSRGRRVGSGVTRGGESPSIHVGLGRAATKQALQDDWVMTHEMVHLAFPDQDSSHSWIEEGISTYVEPFARLQIGELTPEKVWGDLVEGLPQGLPADGDEGLDHTHTWGRTYWGGALFCLLADVKIHQATQDRLGLEDALEGILAAGGSIMRDWSLDRTFDLADRATGTKVLEQLYDDMKATPVQTDLDDLWKQLGVQDRDGKVTFDETAPLAPVRHAIERAKRWY